MSRLTDPRYRLASAIVSLVSSVAALQAAGDIRTWLLVLACVTCWLTFAGAAFTEERQ